MMRFLWNSLRVGDRVRLHPEGVALVDAEVEFVDVRRGGNELGFRVAGSDGRSHVLWPSALVVHAPFGDVEDQCLRCSASS